MKIRICLLIILMGLLYPGYISSQESPYVFRQIGVVEGLPDNYVKSVFPIPDGRIGVRSTVLLSLYDGANYSNFPFNIHGEYSIAYNHIIPEQYIDTDKRLWMKERKPNVEKTSFKAIPINCTLSRSIFKKYCGTFA